MKRWTIANPVFEADELNSKLGVSPWSGHRNFAYDLVNFMKPNRIVELGTHFGCSLFSFCQSIKDYEINSEVIAIDTWEGDPQAGFYEQNVLELVKRTKSKFFSEVKLSLDRRTFQEASKDIADNSIDLLHIDGLHTYEAVSEDFNIWLPKLKEEGIMLFHDTADYTGYGSNIFWKEISKLYPSFEFQQSWGLGVLFPKGDQWYQKMLNENMMDKIVLYYFKAENRLNSIKVNDLESMATERFEAMQQMEQMIKERDEIIESQKVLVEERYDAVQQMEQMIKERDEIIESQKVLVEERYDAVQQMEQMIKERDEIIESQKVLSVERFEAIQQMEQMIKERDEVIDAQKKLVEERYVAMLEMEQMIKERDNSLNLLAEGNK
ncbi:class I SAM-dependent methyltransferase [Paenibacillus sepulcri]|uniref:Class I SAM-dependent methyltransferase n=1 Tax=Paenibacillus sepulcri TaxID=359917 RepID=A0ABS7BVN6_9BACL|nr:class I SAM-dependent methyltransferase [Paenibacillus sepulcri]